MQEALKLILDIQELDMQMIRLMRLKRERQKEVNNIASIKKDLQRKVLLKENEILELKKTIRLDEGEVQLVIENIKKLESQQGSIRKVEEFNALTHEISTAERDRVAKEARLSDFHDKLHSEEELHKTLKDSLDQTIVSSKELEDEIHESIVHINEEGVQLKQQRDEMIKGAEPELFGIYERLLRNKKSRVIVPIENRSCSGCHIMLTAQDENMVRKGERTVFCEHCSRILFWSDNEAIEGRASATKRRRRSVKTT
ncbi:MAG: zinc ribbon domain-containing protein [Chlamydiales bacterium]|nr:zinc ribbon domain-containing protein [Chlamydiales bacterium]